MNKYILVTAEKFGYGPIITCLNIVKDLRPMATKKSIKLVFLGTSIAKEQAEKSLLFDEIIECETYNYDSLKQHALLFQNAQAILCCENQFGAIYAKQLNLNNVFFIDNLVWMWDKITPGLENVDGYFISETFSSKDNFRNIGKSVINPVFVGPLRKINIKTYKSRNQLVINFGGAEAFMLDKEIVVSFYKKILSEILTQDVREKFEKIYVCGGSGIINELQEFSASNIIVDSFSNDNYLKLLHKSSHLIMSSGLGNYIESIGINKNIMYIPPINYSQLLQLDEYKKLDLGLELINWSDYSFYDNIPQLLDEETGVNLVVDNVKKYLKSNDNLISEKVNKFINTTQEKYFDIRKNYVSEFPKNASRVISKYIINSIKG